MRNIQSEYDKFEKNNLNIFIQIVEQSPNSVVITNSDGNIEYVNKMFIELTGYKYEEVINQNPRILNARTQPKEYYSKMWKTVTKGDTWVGEFHNKKKNGDLYRERVKITPIKNGTDKITHYLGIKEDITEQKRTKKKLIEVELRLNEFINNSPSVIYIKDLNGRFINVNPKFRELFDNPKLEIIGKTDYDIFPKILADEFTRNDKVIIKTGNSIQCDEKAISKGQIHHYISVKFPLKNTDNIITGVCGISVDITKRKIAEQKLTEQNKELIITKQKAEESDRLKTEFINNMSHEIRTPMNAILGFSDFLNKSNLTNEKRKHYTSIIQSSGNLLMRIIDDILEISKLGTKQVKISEKQICLNDLLLELFSIFDIKAKENKTPLYLNKGLSDEESIILTDETKLNKILSNLLENALKFTKDGFIEFGYTLKTDNKPIELEIYVKDTGIGIKPESQEIIFERFSQEEKGLSRKVGGLGLGLSIAKENAELLGGKITLKSEKGKGSTFFVTIPYKPVNHKHENDNSNTNKTETAKKQDKYTILIVEDEEVNYLYINTLLEDFELKLITLHAKHGKEAVEMCKEKTEIDFVLMDMKMPIMNGFIATKLIKEFRPNLPIVAQTAYSTSDEKKQAFSAGCDDFISKPISEETLNEVINKYLISSK